MALVKGRVPDRMHNFVAGYLRYQVHVNAYTYLVADPFPSFRGRFGTYPIDLAIAPARPQTRWKTLLRVILVIPAFAFAYVLNQVFEIVGIIGWIVALIMGRMPRGMRDLMAYCLRFQAQTYAYLLLLTDRYPTSVVGNRRQRLSAEMSSGSSGQRPSLCFEKISSPSAITSYWLFSPRSISAMCPSPFSSATRLAARWS